MKNNKAQNQVNEVKKVRKVKIIVATISVLVMLITVFALKDYDKSIKDSVGGDSKGTTTNSNSITKDNDIVIPINNISKTATYYPAEIDGTKLEVLAVEASDGTIRTAFNTCQVCYSSGRGYYVQNGDVLVCQNCGNRFGMDEVEVTRGGCNPVPITTEYKTVDSENITISKDYLAEATAIFKRWKN